ncbi:hypothetical protein CJ010_09725 [Azoarcus sp. DD4]|uniref:hypothetical protein n=1 Tax=Azoarcus sp. DD4 TaxID=2027405 RepID=UPI001125C92C|nr:hypothetical protein [Azoarcus sp. DD4]QDF96787.1 hypothetical protein CJ010_09725 [Azoarcus sp. DD4]
MINPNDINQTELAQDKEALRASAQRVYAAQAGFEREKSWAEHQALLDAFVAKYGSLRVRPTS